jgi:hypothetical protein
MALFKDLKMFQQGGIDFDSAIEYISKNDYLEAYNIRVTGTQEGEQGYVTNIDSNEFVPGERAEGINKGIGGRSFEDTRQIVFFVYNSGGFHQIVTYSSDTQTQQVIYTDKTDSDGIPLLTLNPQYYVQCVLINGTYLVWADGISEVGYTNLQTLTSGGYGTVLAEDLSLIKPQCLIPIKGVYASDAGKASNFLKQKLYQFTVQYVNADFNYSTWATWSKRIIPAQESTPTEGASVSENNCIIVSVNIGSIRATQLNIACKYSDFDFNIIKTVDRSYIVALPNTIIDIANQVFESYNATTNEYSFVFYNQSLNIPVPPTETDQMVDYIWPSTAVEKINGNIIALADLKTGYERPVTSVNVSSSGYDPNLTVPTDTEPNPLKVSVVYAGGEGSGSNKFNRRMQINYSGVPHAGDILNVTTNSASDANDTSSYSYTVPFAQDGNLIAVTSSMSAILAGSFAASGGGYTITFYEDPRPHRRVQIASITLSNTGASISKSIHAILDNSSYQLALSYRDTYGRLFPLDTDNTYIISTQSFAQLNGLTPKISWLINTALAPVGAVDYQWLITKNTTTTNLLDVFGNILIYVGGWDAHSNSPGLTATIGNVGETYQITVPSIPSDNRNLGNGVQQFNTGDYVVCNGKGWDIVPKSFGDLTPNGNVMAIKINPLNLFNQRYTNSSTNSILTYDFSDGDRCTFHYYIDPATPSNKVYFNNPCVDVQVYGYDPTSFLLKIEKSAAIPPGFLDVKNVFIRLYSPNTQKSDSEVTTDNTTVWYEIGERFTITNGNHDTLSGDITDGDVYFKTRSYNGAVDPNVIYDILATDFNFSDFYASNFTSYGRPRTYYDVLEKTEQKATIITSQNYVLGSKKNGLNRFFPESQYGESDGQTSSSYGSIQVLWQRGDILIPFQELRVGYIPVNISILEDAIQQKQYAISEKLLNNIRYNQTGNIGIGLAKESFCFKDNNAYFVDPNRSEPMRLGLDGIEPISGKMSKYFRSTIQLAYSQGKKLVMYYNMFYDEVMLCIQAQGGVLTLFPFNETNWQPFDNYNITYSDITNIADGTHCTATDNGDGTVTYTPTTNYIGNDTATFTFDVDGNPITKNNCLQWVAADVTVNPFSFTPLIAQPLNTLIESNSILVSGINVPVGISIVGGEYSINGGAYTSTPGTVVNNDSVQIRQLSSNLSNTTTSATLTISGTSAQFDVTTKVPVLINYRVTSQVTPFADANLNIRQNGVTVATINGSATGSVNVFGTDSIVVEAYTLLPSAGVSPSLIMTNKKDGVNFYNNAIANVVSASMSNNFIAMNPSVYLITVDGTAS